MAATGRRKITIDVVKALEPGAMVWDADVTGFAVRCQRKAKVYCVKYRVGGRQRWFTIGRHGDIGPEGLPWTPEVARREAKKVLGQVADHKDPAITKAVGKSAPTMDKLVERFLLEHVEAKRKARTAEGYRDILERIVVPKLGQMKVRDVGRPDIARLHHSLRATPYQANRVLAVLSKLFNLAEVWGERAENSNPCRHIEKFPEERRERLLSPQELGNLGAALRKAEDDWGRAEHLRAGLGEARRALQAVQKAGGGEGLRVAAEAAAAQRKEEIEELGDLVSPEAVAAIRLLIFTGARLREILTLEWAWIDLERGEARLPDSKTGAKTVHLPPAALEVLAGIQRLEGNPYVIGGRKAGSHMVNLEKSWRIIRKAAGLHDLRLHDLRHAFAGVAASAGMGLPIIGKMLGQSQPSTTARYAHLADDPVKAAAAHVAGSIEAAMRGQGEAQVVPLPRRKV